MLSACKRFSAQYVILARKYNTRVAGVRSRCGGLPLLLGALQLALSGALPRGRKWRVDDVLTAACVLLLQRRDPRLSSGLQGDGQPCWHADPNAQGARTQPPRDQPLRPQAFHQVSAYGARFQPSRPRPLLLAPHRHHQAGRSVNDTQTFTWTLQFD